MTRKKLEKTQKKLEKNSKKLEKDFGELDCISRAEAIKCLECDFDITGKENMKTVVNYINSAHDKIVNLPSVTPQEPQSFKWCTDCKEYDQEKHCCHRWSKVIRDTVEEMKQEQEPIKPMVEIDLYSVIKQKYIEREVLDKIRAEILRKSYGGFELGEGFRDGYNTAMVRVLNILDKYKSESEADNRDDD